jgi:predicted transcriptional regulator
MPRYKIDTLSIRTTPEIKGLLRQVAEREHRSITAILESLIEHYAKRQGLNPRARTHK